MCKVKLFQMISSKITKIHKYIHCILAIAEAQYMFLPKNEENNT